MRVYVGATFSRYLEVRAVIDALAGAGHEVTLDWTRTPAFGADGHPLPGTGGGYDIDPAEARGYAFGDLAAVERADLALFLAEEPSCGWPIECGYALASSLEVWVVSPFKWTVFWELPQVSVFDGLAEPLARLGAEWR